VTESVSSFSALRRYAIVLRRQWWLIAVVVVLAFGSSVAYVAHKQSVYGAQMKIVVGQGQALFVPDVSNAVQPFTQTMTDLIQSNVVAQQTITRLHLNIKPNVLIGHLSVSSPPEASVLQLTYEDTNPLRAREVLATIGQVFAELVDNRLGGRGAKATSKSTGAGAAAEAVSAPVSATVFDPAHLLPGRLSPKPGRTYLIAIVLGVIAGVLLAFLRDALTSRIRNEEEAHEAFQAPVVGSLPPGTIGTTPAQVPLMPPKLSLRMSESMQVLAATLRYAGSRTENGVILITSAQPEEGKSTVSAQVSTIIAQSGYSVVTVDADLRRPSLHRFFGLESGSSGVGDVLAGEVALADVLISTSVTPTDTESDSFALARGGATRRTERVSVRQPSPSAGNPAELLLLPAGTPHHNPAQVLSLGGLAQLIAQLREVADYVVIDTPPLLISGDAFPLVQLADLVVVVCREGTATREHARALRERLATLGVSEFSVVLTEAAAAQRTSYGYGGPPA